MTKLSTDTKIVKSFNVFFLTFLISFSLFTFSTYIPLHSENQEFIDPSGKESAQTYFLQGEELYKQKNWKEAVAEYRKSLRNDPENSDAKVKLAYALLFLNESEASLKESANLFAQVLKQVPAYTDASEGLTRAQNALGSKIKESAEVQKFQFESSVLLEAEQMYEEGNRAYKTEDWPEAIKAYEEVLKLIPEQIDAKLKLAYALLFSHKDENQIKISQKLFEEILSVNPSYNDASEGLKMVEKIANEKYQAKSSEQKKEEIKKTSEKEWEESLLKLADDLMKQKDHESAIEILTILIEHFPDNADYYYKLGAVYQRMECRETALYYLEKAVEIKPDHSDALTAMGYIYLFYESPLISQMLFTKALSAAPKNTDALVGLAKTEILLENYEIAEFFFIKAIRINSSSFDIISPYAAFLYMQTRFTDSESLYRALDNLEDNPNKFRDILFDVTALTHHSSYQKGTYAEEREKDQFTGNWVASLRTIIAEAGLRYPTEDKYRFGLRGRRYEMRQRNLISKNNTFEFKSEAVGSIFEWFYPFWTVTFDLNSENIRNIDSKALLHTKGSTRWEPTLLFRYAKDSNLVVFGEISDSIVFRDFEKFTADVVTREAAFLSYVHNFEKEQIGMDASWIWFNDPIQNQEQILNSWFQIGVPCLSDHLSARYHCEYKHFYHETSGYYSFQYQLTHWIKLLGFYKWDVGTRCEVEYWHGWRTTRGRAPQEQLVISPIPAIIPVTTVDSTIDQVFLTLGYRPTECCDFSLTGTYYHDSFDYTAWLARFVFDWRF